MLDLRLIREEPERVKAAIATTYTEAPIDEILVLDERRRALLAEVEARKAELNRGSKQVGRMKEPAEREALIAQMRELGDRIATLDEEVKGVDERLHGLMLQVPNIPLEHVPVAPDESGNVVIAEFGAKREFDFAPKPHWELAEELGIIDFERGVKISGSRFYVLRGEGAQLQRALIAWMLDLHINEHGYQEVYPPYLVLGETLVGTGNLPKFSENLYRDAEEDKWLIPTAEVPVTNLYRDEILEEAQLPIYHVAYTPCFRREQISAGRDVRGIKRGYQFDKVEMVKFVHPDESEAEHKRLIEEASDVLRALALPYRLVQLSTGDLGFAAADKVDLEAWAPGSREWLEVSSCGRFMDFQARRANIRFRPTEGGRIRHVHTLNGSGLALPRTMIAIMEQYQQPDGTIEVPMVLRPYMGGKAVIGKQPAIGPASSRVKAS
ncbi:MAG: serine--tRNA ligase [Thermomicrobiales bacterium]|nr:serine--tRNA ligase [Thermomicrobiales bacterium]